MRSRKRTACPGCGRYGRYDLLELLWRLGGTGPWSWAVRWFCASCRHNAIEVVQLRLPVEVVPDDTFDGQVYAGGQRA